MVAPPTSATLACSVLVSSTFWLFKSLRQAYGASSRQAASPAGNDQQVVNPAGNSQQSQSLQGYNKPQLQGHAQQTLRPARRSGTDATAGEMRHMGTPLPEQATQSDA